jgi:hypothetical protein
MGRRRGEHDDIPVPLWAWLLAGSGVGPAIVALLAARWPFGLLAMPCLAGWVLLVSRRVSASGHARRTLYLIVGLVTALLGASAIGLLATLP